MAEQLDQLGVLQEMQMHELRVEITVLRAERAIGQWEQSIQPPMMSTQGPVAENAQTVQAENRGQEATSALVRTIQEVRPNQLVCPYQAEGLHSFTAGSN